VTAAVPRYASNPKPEYPRLARQNRWEGVVQLRAWITTSGEVEQVVVEQGSGHVVLDQAAVNGVRRWRFVPARHGDQLIACEVRIPIAFRLEE
jgi:protein TonB